MSSAAVGGMTRFKAAALAAARQSIDPRNLILAATHTHSAPESLALTDLHTTPAFKQWIETLAERIGGALRRAGESKRRCRLVLGSAEARGHAIHRRIKTTHGVVLSHPPPPSETVVSSEGPVDDRVVAAGFADESGEPIAIIANATCHPVHEMCLRRVSPDYPGAMSAELERRHPGAVALFLNGAAGNINPPTVSGGAGDAERHGRRLAEVVEQALRAAQPARGDCLALERRRVHLPARTADGRSAGAPLAADIAALVLGNAASVFLPGEPFVEIGLAIREQSPFDYTAVVSYADDYIGYIPADGAFDEGGYELGPWAVGSRGPRQRGDRAPRRGIAAGEAERLGRSGFAIRKRQCLTRSVVRSVLPRRRRPRATTLDNEPRSG
jgi:hypothetical protein